MLRRLPPVVIALGATLALLVVVVTAFVVLGGDQGRPLQPCSAALDAGPYGCVVFVSVDGSVAGQQSAEPQNGAITFRVERSDGQDVLIWTGDCNGGVAPVAVTADRLRIGTTSSGVKACEGGSTVDEWADGLFQGTVRVTEADDATSELVHGDRRARFAQVIAPRS